MTDEQTAGQRIVAALDSLGIEKAHLGTGAFAIEAPELIGLRPGLVGSLTLVTPAAALPAYAGSWPILGVFGSSGNAAMTGARREMIGWETVRVVELPGDYDVQAWSDVISDHTSVLCGGIREVASLAALPDAKIPAGEQEIDGIRMLIEGSGPPLVLIPSGLWPSQWNAAIPDLATDFTVIRLGGRYLGPVAFLEERAAGPSFASMVDLLFERLAIQPGETVVEVGTGSGALSRQLARRTGNGNKIIALDISEFSLEEAEVLARDLDANIEWRRADATALALEDASIDVIFAVTVFEECDVERALADMKRVLKPGGRAGVIVRALDLPMFWNLDLPEDIAAETTRPLGAATAEGCADRTLYERFASRFVDVEPYAHWASVAPPTPAFVNMKLGQLRPEHRQPFQAAVQAGTRAGTAFAANPFHCVVGKKG